MVMFLALVGAFVLTPPTPRGDPASWVPPAFLESVTDSEGTTVFDLMIDANGVPVSCVTTKRSGIAALDQAVCAALIKNGRFKAASDERGSALPGVWSDNVHWNPHVHGETRYTSPPAEFIVEIPEGVKSTKSVTIRTVSIINPDSSIAGCSVSKPSISNILNSKACELVASLTHISPIRDAEGAPVRGVRAIAVTFTNKGS